MPQMNVGNGGASSTAQSGYLVQGAKGEDVRELQKTLKAAGFDPGPIDGDFGELTKAALEGFQQGRGLEPDAILGPLTRNALSQVPALTAPTGAPPPRQALGGKAEDYGAATTPLSGASYTGATPVEEQRLRTAVAAQPPAAPVTRPTAASFVTPPPTTASRLVTPPPTRADLYTGATSQEAQRLRNAMAAQTGQEIPTVFTPGAGQPGYTGATGPEDQRLRNAIIAQGGLPYAAATPQEDQRLRNAVAADQASRDEAARQAAAEAAREDQKLRNATAAQTPVVTPTGPTSTPPAPTTGGAVPPPVVTPKPAGPPITTPTPVVPPKYVPPPTTPILPGGVPTGGVPTGATTPVGQGSNIAGLFNLPTGTQYAPPAVTTPNITTPTFAAPGAAPQAPAQQVTPERQALLAQLNRLQQNNAPQVTYSPFNYQAPPAMTYEEAQRRAAGQLNPQYAEALQDRMAALSTQMRQTGMYGQAPTIPITQEAAARIEAARMAAVGGQANVLMSQASQEALQQRQLAQSQWGQETSLALQAQGMNADEAQRKVANILAVAQAVDQQKAQEAGLTGYYGGAPTMQRAGMEAELTGMYGGAETWGRQAQRAQLALSAQTAQTQAQQQAQAQAWQQQVQHAGLTGVYGGAPTLEARSAQAAAQQADIAAQQRAQEFGWQRTAQEAGLTGAYGGQPTLQARQYGTEAAAAQAQLDWQKQYQGGSLAQQQAELDWQRQYQQGQLDIGRQPTVRTPEQQVSDRVANKYLSGATLTPDERRLLGLTDAEAELRERAVAAAQKDPGYFKTGADKAAIIQEYENFLRGGGAATGGVGGGFDLDQYLKGQGVPVK